MRRLSIILCLTVLPSPAAAEQAARTPVHLFFVGCTQGRGVLKIVARRSRNVTVDSLGSLHPDGTLVVSQTVTQEGKLVTRRAWRLREAGSGQFVGTLSGATGPVTGAVSGGTLHLRFNMKGGFRAHQHLALNTDGSGLLNVMTIRKLGVVVGRLREEVGRCPAAV
jgi:hypothetical protein